MNLKSEFAILSVKSGKVKLAKHFAKRPRGGPCPKELRIPVTITGYIDDQWSGDDGIDCEFSVCVTDVETP